MQGNTQAESQHIIQALEQYYRHLYTEEVANQQIQDKFLQHTKKLSEVYK